MNIKRTLTAATITALATLGVAAAPASAAPHPRWPISVCWNNQTYGSSLEGWADFLASHPGATQGECVPVTTAAPPTTHPTETAPPTTIAATTIPATTVPATDEATTTPATDTVPVDTAGVVVPDDSTPDTASVPIGSVRQDAPPLPDVCSPNGKTTIGHVMPCDENTPPASEICTNPAYAANTFWQAYIAIICVPSDTSTVGTAASSGGGAVSPTTVALTLPSTGAASGLEVAIATIIVLGGIALVIAAARRRPANIS